MSRSISQNIAYLLTIKNSNIERWGEQNRHDMPQRYPYIYTHVLDIIKRRKTGTRTLRRVFIVMLQHSSEEKKKTKNCVQLSMKCSVLNIAYWAKLLLMFTVSSTSSFMSCG